jgi:hypothetical protein
LGLKLKAQSLKLFSEIVSANELIARITALSFTLYALSLGCEEFELT